MSSFCRKIGILKNYKLFLLLIIGLSIIFFATPAFAEEINISDYGRASTENDQITETTFFGNVEDDGNGCGVWMTINLVITVLTYGIGIAATIGLVIAAVLYLTAGDNADQYTKAKTRILEIVIGLAAYAAMWSIASWLIPGGIFNNGDICKTSESTVGSSSTRSRANRNDPTSSHSSGSISSSSSNINANEKFRDRVAALKPWRDILVNTFSYINGRTYSFSSPGKYWETNGKWNGKTGGNGHTQSCITLPTVSLKRAGYMSKKSKNFWLSGGNMGTKPNKTVKKLAKNSDYLYIFYPHKSLKSLVNSGKVEYGDVIVRSGHTFVYMGKGKGDYRIYQGGGTREISKDTHVTWGHYKNGKAKPITKKIRKQIAKSDAVLKKYKNQPSHFTGVKAKGKNLNAKVHIVGHIKTFTVKTGCKNGVITASNLYMAKEDVVVNYKPNSGKTLDYVKVDGKKVSGHNSSYTFNNIADDHTIEVVYK